MDTGCGGRGLSLQFLGQPLGVALASPGGQGLGKAARACPRPHCGGSLTPLREVRVLGLQGTPLPRLSHTLVSPPHPSGACPRGCLIAKTLGMALVKGERPQGNSAPLSGKDCIAGRYPLATCQALGS